MSPGAKRFEQMLRDIQEKHHPGSRDVAAGDRDFLEGTFPEDDLDELDEYAINGGDDDGM